MSERSSFQNPILRYTGQIGWQYINPLEALRLRGDETGLYFSDILISQLLKLNPGVLDPSRASEILRKLIALASKSSNNPILRLIGERTLALRQAYEDRQITTQEALTQFEDLAQDYLDADKERERLGLDENSLVKE